MGILAHPKKPVQSFEFLRPPSQIDLELGPKTVTVTYGSMDEARKIARRIAAKGYFVRFDIETDFRWFNPIAIAYIWQEWTPEVRKAMNEYGDNLQLLGEPLDELPWGELKEVGFARGRTWKEAAVSLAGELGVML